MRLAPSALPLCLLLSACGGPAPRGPDPLAELTVPALPAWTDRYRDTAGPDARFFNISALMARHQLTRLQAVALQNHYRDRARAEPSGDPEARFAEALARVQRGEYESGLDPAALAEARVIVVFDLDDTLYDQYGATADCHDLSFERADGRTKYIQRANGWAEAFERIGALGGEVAIFSANLDASTLENLRHWTWGDAPLAEHPRIAGVLTNSHLVQQEKTEGLGRENPRRGQPVIEPSKDLRVFDEALNRVIIVDDNPDRLFQLGNTRLFKKLHAEALCGDDQPLKAALGQALEQVVDEVEEALTWSRANGTDFITAWRPYSVMGQVAQRLLMESGLSAEQAREHLRRHPEIVDAKF